jgi:Methyltransferase FkbM domain
MVLNKFRALRRHILWDRLTPLLNQRWVTAIHNRYYEKFASPDVRRYWDKRIELVLESSDNTFIKRVPDAGKVRNGYQVMHNGQESVAGGYYCFDVLRMMQLSRGVHEPQEERVFQEVLPYIPAGATMLELGAYWGFYSMWFLQQVKQGRAILVEPSLHSMAIGKHNFKHNRLKGEFIRAYVGAHPDSPFDNAPSITVDEILKSRGVETLHILHADVQSAELDMLNGCEEAFKNKRIHYLFISSHSNELHDACEARLKALGFEILASINMDDSYAEDGILVAKLPGIPGPAPFELSRRTKKPTATTAA